MDWVTWGADYSMVAMADFFDHNWAEFRKTKAAVKLHALIDLRDSIPTYVAAVTMRSLEI
jgi:hypothetical protein